MNILLNEFFLQDDPEKTESCFCEDFFITGKNNGTKGN